MSMQDNLQFVPIQVSTQLYSKWEYQTVLKNQKDLYYKCMEGNGFLEMKNGNKYKGKLVNGLMHGQGEYQWASGLKYIGSFDQNCLTGKGKFIWPDGSFYEGEVQKGYRHGYGTFMSKADQYLYKGKWKYGLKDGKGRIQFNNGKSSYQGQFKNDKRNGKGKVTYPSLNQYEGQWNDNRKQGYGVMNWHDSHQRYAGNWKNNQPHGYGEYYWFDNKIQFKILKNIFKGEWKQGKKNGFGVFFHSNGCKFEGYYKSNLKEGVGITFDEYGFGKVQHFHLDKSLALANKNFEKHERGLKQLKLPKPTLKQKNSHASVERFSMPDHKGSVLNEPVRNYEYKKILDFTHPQIDDNFLNFLLRINTRFRNIYRHLSQSSTEIKEYYSGMTLQNYWKGLRDVKIINQNLSLIKICKQFFKGSRSYFEAESSNRRVFEIMSNSSKLITETNDQNILWSQYMAQLKAIDLNWENLKINQEVKFEKIKTKNISKSQQIILFRHFVCLIIHTAKIMQGNSLKKNVQNIVMSLEENLDITKNLGQKQKTIDNMTNQSSIKQIVVPQWSFKQHQRFSSMTCPQICDIFGKVEISFPIRTLFDVLKQNGVYKDANQSLLSLQRVQRYLSIKNSFLKKQYKPYFTQLQKIVRSHPYFSSLMNYELTQRQMSQFLFLSLSRKTITHSQQEFKAKYRAIIDKLICYVESVKHQSKQQTPSLKYKRMKTKKDDMKIELIRVDELRKIQQLQQRKIKEEKEREEEERRKMSKQDHDIKDFDSQSDKSSEYYI